MIFTLNILIDLCLIAAILLLSKRKRLVEVRFPIIKKDKKLYGKLDKMYIRSIIAEKMSERAFNLASTANLGIVALQKSLLVPRLMTKTQGLQNKLAKEDINGLFSNGVEGSGFDWLRPILSPEENDILDKISEHNAKFNMNNPT